MTGRALYDVDAPDALAHWLAQHPHVVMLAGSSQLDSYLDTGTGALLQQGQILRIRRRDGSTAAMLRDLASDTTHRRGRAATAACPRAARSTRSCARWPAASRSAPSAP